MGSGIVLIERKREGMKQREKEVEKEKEKGI
jgi:hypothetical protein